MLPDPHHALIDPALLGVLAAAVEEESSLAYEAGFSDGLRAASFRPPPEPGTGHEFEDEFLLP